MNKKSIFIAFLTFLVSYLLFLIVWIQVKDYYGRGLAFTASKLVAGVKGMKFEEIAREGDLLWVTFSPLSRHSSLLMDVPVRTSSYTFNVPLTLSIMAALYHFVRKRKRAFAEGLILLLSVHLAYVFSLEAKELTEALIRSGLESQDHPRLIFYQFLWGFTDNMAIRFEPFLIGFYIFMRFKK